MGFKRWMFKDFEYTLVVGSIFLGETRSNFWKTFQRYETEEKYQNDSESDGLTFDMLRF